MLPIAAVDEIAQWADRDEPSAADFETVFPTQEGCEWPAVRALVVNAVEQLPSPVGLLAAGQATGCVRVAGLGWPVLNRGSQPSARLLRTVLYGAALQLGRVLSSPEGEGGRFILWIWGAGPGIVDVRDGCGRI